MDRSCRFWEGARDGSPTTRWVAETTAAIKQATEDYKAERAQTKS